jgi:hypothetical protein
MRFHLYSREALMKRIQKFVAVNVMAALIGAGVPAIAAEQGHDHGRSEIQSHAFDHHENRGRNNDRNRRYGNNDRWDRDRNDHRRDYDRGYVYAPAPVYRGPVYENGYYDDGYYDRETHNGRTAAIIGGSAAAGAVIGAAVGHGQGAAIGAVIGGIAGTVASVAADHHDRF